MKKPRRTASVQITAERLRELLHYDPDTGLFVWKVTLGSRAARGGVAGNIIKGTGYVQIQLDGENYLAHRLAVLYVTGEWPTVTVDHEDLDRTNNRWKNLRHATQSQNNANRGKNKNNTSGFKGVTWSKQAKRWQAQIMVNRRHITLGQFADPEVAHRAYVTAAEKYFGEFARTA